MYTFFLLVLQFDLAALGNDHLLRWLITGPFLDILNLVDDFLIAFQNLAKDDVPTVQPAVETSAKERQPMSLICTW